jgi:hypothetical protein
MIRRAHAMLEQAVSCPKSYTKLPSAGYGAQAAIGQLTHLTSLLMCVAWMWTGTSPPLNGAPYPAPLQLNLLGCGSWQQRRHQLPQGCGGGSSAAGRVTRACNILTLQCDGWLSDEDLAAAAGALPDLRRIEVVENTCYPDGGQINKVRGWRHSAPAAGCGKCRCSTAMPCSSTNWWHRCRASVPSPASTSRSAARWTAAA